MKKFVSTILLVVATMCSLLFGFASLVLGFRIMELLTRGAINPTLCLEFLLTVVLLGVCLACMRTFEDRCDVDVKFTSDTIVGKHKEDDEE